MAGFIFLERLMTLAIGFMENLIHGGVIFGWPSLVFTLKQIGYFSDICPLSSENDTTVSPPISDSPATTMEAGDSLPSCGEQDARLQLVFAIATGVQPLCMFPAGFLFDNLGLGITRIILSVLMLIGYLLMGFSSPEYSNLLFPGTILFTVAGVMLLLSSMEIGNLFRSHKSTAITFINAAYSASVFLFLVIKVAYEAGFSVNVLFFILAGSTFLFNINTFIFLPKSHIPWPLPEKYRLVKCGNGNSDEQSKAVSPSSGDEQLAHQNLGYVDDEVFTDENDKGHSQTPQNGNGVVMDVKENGEEPAKRNLRRRRSSKLEENFTENRRRSEYSSLSACILSPAFWLILVWQIALELDMIFTFGTLNNTLNRLADGDNDIVSWYTDIFSIIQILVIVVGPLGGLLMDRNKKGKVLSCCQGNKPRGPYSDHMDSCLPLAIATLASIGYSVCLLIPSLPLQYLTFVLILILRSLLFGVGSAVVAIVFPMKYFASVYGAIRTISGIFSFLQYPLFILIQNVLNNDPFYVTIAFIAADGLSFLLPAYLYISSKRKHHQEKKPIKPII